MRQLRWCGVLLAVAMTMAGCAAYSLVEGGGPVTVGNGFRVTPEIAWSMTNQKGVYLWTVDGPNLERLLFFPGVVDGAPLIPPADNSQEKKMPLFRDDMTLVEVADLLEATMSRLECHQFVKQNLRPAPFAGQDGFRFDFSFVSKDGLEYRGTASGAVKGGKLYLVMYTGTAIHYFDQYASVVEHIFTTIQLL